MVGQNTGWLPTQVTRRARDINTVRGVRCEPVLPDVARLVSGKLQEDAGQREGRAYKASAPTRRPADPSDDRAKVEWVIVGTARQSIGITASHPRAGAVRPSVILA
ncbi:MAG: hypothetical protein ACOYOM_08010 [Chloroflexota bacterium]